MFLPDVARILLHATSPVVCVPATRDAPAIVAMQGTLTLRDLLVDDLDVRPVRWHGARVHGGFARRARRLLRDTRQFVEAHDEIVFAGHSMGGACVALAAFDLAQADEDRVRGVYTFGAPCFGTRRFCSLYENQLTSRTIHFGTPRDPVVHTIPDLYSLPGDRVILECDVEDAWAQHDMRSYAEALRASHDLSRRRAACLPSR